MAKKKNDYGRPRLTSEKLEEIVSEVKRHCDEQHEKEITYMSEINTKLRDEINTYRERIYKLRKLVKAMAREIIA